MLNSEHLSLVNKIGDKTEFTITRVHCTKYLVNLRIFTKYLVKFTKYQLVLCFWLVFSHSVESPLCNYSLVFISEQNKTVITERLYT